MSLRRIRAGELLLLVAVAALVVSLFLPWFALRVPHVDGRTVTFDGRDGWGPLGHPWLELVALAGVAWVATIVLAVRSGAGRPTYGAVSAAVIGFFMTGVVLVVVLLRAFVVLPGFFAVFPPDATVSMVVGQDLDASFPRTTAAGAWMGLGALLLGLAGLWAALSDDRSRAAESIAVDRPAVRAVPPLRPDGDGGAAADTATPSG